MAARIEVLSGPDRGCKFTLVGTEARLGRGAGHQVSFRDPSWSSGTIRVQLRQGGYLVTNEMPHPVFLDGKSLAPSQASTLHHGSTLQPTGNTLLKLEIVDAPGGPRPEDGVIASAQAVPAKFGNIRKHLPLLALLVAGGFYASSQVSPARSMAGSAIQQGNSHKRVLKDLASEPDLWTLRPRLERTHDLIAAAMFQESCGRPADAHARYREARDALKGLADSLAADSVHRKALTHVSAFVNDRLRATAGYSTGS